MQTRSFRGSGEPAWVNASPNACFGLGPDPRRALGPAAIRAASTGRTHDRTRPMLHHVKKALVNQAPSTHDPKRSYTHKIDRVRLDDLKNLPVHCSLNDVGLDVLERVSTRPLPAYAPRAAENASAVQTRCRGSRHTPARNRAALRRQTSPGCASR